MPYCRFMLFVNHIYTFLLENFPWYVPQITDHNINTEGIIYFIFLKHFSEEAPFSVWSQSLQVNQWHWTDQYGLLQQPSQEVPHFGAAAEAADWHAGVLCREWSDPFLCGWPSICSRFAENCWSLLPDAQPWTPSWDFAERQVSYNGVRCHAATRDDTQIVSCGTMND